MIKISKSQEEALNVIKNMLSHKLEGNDGEHIMKLIMGILNIEYPISEGLIEVPKAPPTQIIIPDGFGYSGELKYPVQPPQVWYQTDKPQTAIYKDDPVSTFTNDPMNGFKSSITADVTTPNNELPS